MTLQNCKQAYNLFYLCQIGVMLAWRCPVYNPKLSWSWFTVSRMGVERQRLMCPFLWLVVCNGLLPSLVFCFLTVNLTKVDQNDVVVLYHFQPAIEVLVKSSRTNESWNKWLQMKGVFFIKTIQLMLSSQWHQILAVYCLKLCITQAPWKQKKY